MNLLQRLNPGNSKSQRTRNRGSKSLLINSSLLNCLLPTATALLLDGRVLPGTEGTEHAAIARFGLQQRLAVAALVEELAGVRRHVDVVIGLWHTPLSACGTLHCLPKGKGDVLMNDDTSTTKIEDLDEKRNRRRVTNALNNLLKDTRNGTLKCAAIRLYYKDGTSEVKVIGGKPEEQAETLARLEAEEVKGKVLMEELRPILDEVFAHLPEDERQRIVDSPERIRRALNILSDDRLRNLHPFIQERLTKCKTLIEELWPEAQKT